MRRNFCFASLEQLCITSGVMRQTVELSVLYNSSSITKDIKFRPFEECGTLYHRGIQRHPIKQNVQKQMEPESKHTHGSKKLL